MLFYLVLSFCVLYFRFVVYSIWLCWCFCSVWYVLLLLACLCVCLCVLMVWLFDCLLFVVFASLLLLFALLLGYNLFNWFVILCFVNVVVFVLFSCLRCFCLKYVFCCCYALLLFCDCFLGFAWPPPRRLPFPAVWSFETCHCDCLGGFLDFQIAVALYRKGNLLS